MYFYKILFSLLTINIGILNSLDVMSENEFQVKLVLTLLNFFVPGIHFDKCKEKK